MEITAPTEPQKKKRSNKHQDDSQRTRNSQVKIRLTKEEVAELKAAAASDGISMTDFIMASVHKKRRIVVPDAIDLRKELLKEGNDLNQAFVLVYVARKEGQTVDLQSI